MAQIFPNEVSVIIGAAGAVSSTAANKTFTTYLSNFKVTLPSKDISSVPLFGGAYVAEKKPSDPIEMSFDFVMDYSVGLLFAQLLVGSTLDGSTAIGSKDAGTDKAIYVQAQSGSNYYTHALNNATCTSVEKELAADGYMTGSVTLKAVSATNAATPLSNYKEAAAAASTIVWSSG